MKFSCLDNDVSGENIVEDNVLDEVVSVIFFVIVLLDVGECDSKYACVLCSSIVNALNKDRIIRLYS